MNKKFKVQHLPILGLYMVRCGRLLEGFLHHAYRVRFSLMLDHTSSMKGLALVYTMCGAPYQFGAVSSVNSSIFLWIKHNAVNNPNPIIIIQKFKYSIKRKGNNGKHTNTNKFTIFLSKIFNFKSQKKKKKKTHLKKKKTKLNP